LGVVSLVAVVGVTGLPPGVTYFTKLENIRLNHAAIFSSIFFAGA
jgi:hypothetical protein